MPYILYALYGIIAVVVIFLAVLIIRAAAFNQLEL